MLGVWKRFIRKRDSSFTIVENEAAKMLNNCFTKKYVIDDSKFGFHSKIEGFTKTKS